MEIAEYIEEILGTIAVVAVGWFLVSRYALASKRGDTVSVTEWHAYALSRNLDFFPSEQQPKMSGTIDEHPVSVIARIIESRGRMGQRNTSAQTTFRVPIRGHVTRGLLIRRRALGNRVRGLFDGGRPIETGVAEVDQDLIVVGADPIEVKELVAHDEVRKAVLALFRACPGAVLHERAIEFETPNMVVSSEYLDLYMNAMVAAANTIESHSESEGFQGAFRTPSPAARSEGPTQGVAFGDLPEDAAVTLIPDQYVPDIPDDDDDDEDVPTDVGEPDDVASEGISGFMAPKERLPTPPLTQLHVALRVLASARTEREKMMRVQTLRLTPYRYKIEVRSVVEGLSRLGIPNGKLQVNGVLAEAKWRIELFIDAAHANAVLVLVNGDIIEGECLLEAFRGGTVLEALGRDAPDLVEKSRVRLDL